MATNSRAPTDATASPSHTDARDARHQIKPPQRGAENRHFGSLRPASLRRHMRSAAPFSPQFCTCAPTAERRCLLGSVHAGEQPHRSRSATVSRSERSAQATRPPLAALATDLIASLISRPSASKLSMMDIVDREADAERPRGVAPCSTSCFPAHFHPTSLYPCIRQAKLITKVSSIAGFDHARARLPPVHTAPFLALAHFDRADWRLRFELLGCGW